MRINKQNVRKDIASCNFCNKGELSKNRMGLVYPYEDVICFGKDNGNGMVGCICEECLDELHLKGKKEFKT